MCVFDGQLSYESQRKHAKSRLEYSEHGVKTCSDQCNTIISIFIFYLAAYRQSNTCVSTSVRVPQIA